MSNPVPPIEITIAVRHPPRPALLIAFWVVTWIVLMAISLPILMLIGPGTSPFHKKILLAIGYLSTLLLDSNSFAAWWLAMFVSHSKRTISVPMACVFAGVVWDSVIMNRYAVQSLFSTTSVFAWSDLGNELWRMLASSTAAVSLQLVCVGGICYLLSRLTHAQLNRSDHIPQHTTLDVRRILGLTLMVALVFAVARWASSNQPKFHSELFPGGYPTAFLAIGGVSTGLNWAVLSWVYAKVSVRLGIVAAAGLLILQIGITYMSYWMLSLPGTAKEIPLIAPNIVVTTGYQLASFLWIFFVFRVAKYCGYQLNFYSLGKV